MDFIQFLAKKKILNKEKAFELREEAEKSGRKPEELILESGLISEEELFQLKSEFLGIPLKKGKAEKISKEALKAVPRESVEFYKMVPLKFAAKGVLEIGMVYPEDTQAQEALKFLARQEKFKPKVFLISPSDFQHYIEVYQSPDKEMEIALKALKKQASAEKAAAEDSLSSEKFKKLVEEAPIIKMVDVILRQAVEGKASDIHIEPSADRLKIRYRMDGILYPSLFLPITAHSAIVARIKILSHLKIDETRIPQDGRFSTKIGGKKIDYRVATFPTTLGEKVAIRILDPGEGKKTLPDLGFEDRDLDVVQRAVKKPYGMILSTGPTGSGKSTTLYTLLRILNKEAVNIVTLEDPVEYFIEGVNQSQVRPDINYTFAAGLRQILRQDPDIIMVGEIRDQETAALAVHAGLTGHLVLSTLHTTSAVGVIPRLVDMGVEKFLLPPTLNAIISQRLARVLCPFCKEKVKLQGDEKKYVLEKMKNIPQHALKKVNLKDPLYVYRPKGCEKCKFKGYSGRTGLFETIEMTPSLSSIISRRFSEEEVLKEARSQGMISMEENGILKALRGITSLEEIMRVAKSA